MGFLSQALAEGGDSTTSTKKKKKHGGLFGLDMPDLGIGNLVHGLVSLPGTLVRAGGEASTGDWTSAADMGKGFLSSFAGTGLNAVDVASLGLAHKQVDDYRERWGDLLGGGDEAKARAFTPRTLMEQYNDGGLAPTIAENVGNVAIGAGIAAKVGALSEVGRAAEAGLTAERAAKSGATAEEISNAARVASEGSGLRKFASAGIKGDLKAAGKAAARAENIDTAALDAAAVAKRAKTLEVLHAFEHPYRTLLNKAIVPLGRAATGQQLGNVAEAATQSPAEAPVAAEAAAPVKEPANIAAARQGLSDLAGSVSEAPVETNPLQAALDEVLASQARDVPAGPDVSPGEGKVPLFRGENPTNKANAGEAADAGRWFTDNEKLAREMYAGEGGTVHRVDVPQELLDQLKAEGGDSYGGISNGADEGFQYRLPEEYRGTGRLHEPEGAAAVAESVPEAPPANAFVDDATRAYAAENGLPEPTPVDTTAQVNPTRGRIVEALYRGAPSSPDSPEVQASYGAFADDIKKQWEFLKRQGVNVEFVDRPASGGIYPDEQTMFNDIQSGVLKVDRTGPSEEHLMPAMNEVIDVAPDGTPVTVNDAFRAVHDFFGHSRAGNLFDRHGEDVAWRLHAQMFSPEAQAALFTETVGQNSYLNFNAANVAAKALGGTPEFPPQKAALLPEAVRRVDFNPPTGNIEAELRVAAAQPVPEWATRVVESLPDPAVRAVAKVDRFITARKVGMVIKERIRQQEIERRRYLDGEVMAPLRQAAADYLVGQTMPDGTVIGPELAQDLVGDHLIARLNLVEALEHAAETVPGATEEGMTQFRAALEQANARLGDRIPQEMLQDLDGNRTPLGDAMDEGVARLRADESTRLDILTGTRKGTKGLERVGENLPSLSTGAQRLLATAADDYKQASILEATRIPRERAAALREAERIGDQITATGARIKQAEEDGTAALADFDRSRGADLPKVMHDPDTWAQAVDTIVTRTLERGGASYDPRAGRLLEPIGQGGSDGGWAVGAVPETVRTVELTANPQTNAEAIANAVDEASRAYQDLFRSPNVIVGTWTEGNRVHVDVSEIVPTRDEALLKASARAQMSVYDLTKPVDHPNAFPEPAGRADVSAKFLRRNRNRTRFATQLRRTFDKINAERAKAGLEPAVTPEDIDAQMAVNDLVAVSQARNQPGRFKHPDMVYATMEARFRKHVAGLRNNPRAYLEMALGKDLNPEVVRHASEVVDNLDRVAQWYTRTNEAITKRFTKADGTPWRITLGNGKQVDVSDLMFQLIAATSIQQTPGMNLADALHAVGNYSKIAGEYEDSAKFWNKLMDDFLRTPAHGKPGEFGATSPRTLTELFKRATSPGDSNVHRYWTARFPVIEILNGNTLDTWGDTSGPLPDFESRFSGLTDELRAATPEEHHHIIDAAINGDITPDDAAKQLRKVVAPEARDLLKSSGDTWRVRVSQHQRFQRGEVSYVEARQDLPGSIPKEMDRAAALSRIDPDVIARLGEDRAVMEYYGQLAWAKVRSFYDNLKNPATSDHVTLDMWMARLLGMDRKLDLMKPGEYLRVAEEVRGLGEAMGDVLGRKVKPHETQAALWAYAMSETQSALEDAYKAGEIPKPPRAMDWRDFADHLENPGPRLRQALAYVEQQQPNTFFDSFRDNVLGAMVAGGDEGNRNLMLFFDKADPVTLAHEHAHAIRQILSPEDMRTLERAYDIRGGKWERAHEERFATDFEQYLSTGRAPTEGLKPYFARIRSFLSEAWRVVRGQHRLDPEVRQLFDRMLNPADADIAAADIMPTGPLDSEKFLEGAGERIARSPRQRAQSTPGIEMSTADAYRRGLKGGEALATRDAMAERVSELRARKARMEKNLEQIKRSLYEHTLTSELERNRLLSRADRRIDRVAKQMEHPSLSNVPPAWKPVWGALQELHKAAADQPELAAILEDMPETWDTVLRTAVEKGFDPTHIRSFSPTEVRQLVYGTVQLGKKGRDLGQSIEAGTRKARRGAQARTRSFDALAAATVEATHEKNTNALADFIDQTWARPVENGEIPRGYVGWDAERSYLLTGEKTAQGTTKVEGMGAPTRMIPKEVKSVLDAYQRDFHHGFFNALRTVTDPWRLFILTLSPRWYVNNILGNVMLTTKEGVGLGDWARAWQVMHKEGRVTDFTKKFVSVSEEEARNSRAAIAGSIQSDIGQTPTLVSYPKGIEGLRMMRSEHGTAAALKMAQRNLAKGNEVVDEMARVATYFSGRRKGMSMDAALHRTFKVLVDYNDLSPLERQFVRSVVPFYAWQKGMLKMVAKLPIDHPKAVPLLLSLDRVNKELVADQYGGELPDYYQSIVPIPGLGNVNLRGANPLQDSGALTTPEGIAQAMNPYLRIAVRNAFGAPDGGFTTHYRVNEFGQRVPTTSPAAELGGILTGLPQARAVTGQRGLLRNILQYGGVPSYSDEDVRKIVERNLKSRKAG